MSAKPTSLDDFAEAWKYLYDRSPEVLAGATVCVFRGGERFGPFASRDAAYYFMRKTGEGRVVVFPPCTPESACVDAGDIAGKPIPGV